MIAVVFGPEIPLHTSPNVWIYTEKRQVIVGKVRVFLASPNVVNLSFGPKRQMG
jgi:hypothetical protein